MYGCVKQENCKNPELPAPVFSTSAWLMLVNILQRMSHTLSTTKKTTTNNKKQYSLIANKSFSMSFKHISRKCRFILPPIFFFAIK